MATGDYWDSSTTGFTSSILHEIYHDASATGGYATSYYTGSRPAYQCKSVEPPKVFEKYPGEQAEEELF